MRTRVMKASSKCLQLRTYAIVASLRFVASFIHPAKEGHDLDLTQSLPNVHASVNKSVRLQYNAMQFFFTPPFLHQIPLNSLIFYSHRFSSFSKSFSFRVLYQRVISPSLSLSLCSKKHYRYLHSAWCTIVCIINSKHICIFRAAYIHGKTIINIARLIRFCSGLAGTILISAIVIILSFFLSLSLFNKSFLTCNTPLIINFEYRAIFFSF